MSLSTSKSTWLLFTMLSTLYIWTASPSMGALDSPEFIAASVGMGIPHSPGHPLPVFLGKLMTLFPLGDMVWRINILNSVFMALSGAIFFRCALKTQNLFLGSIHSIKAIPFLATLTVFVSWSFWEHASRAEVYAFELLTLLCALYTLLGWLHKREHHSLLLSCFLIGLGFSNHHWMTLCFALPGAVLIFSTSTFRPRMSVCISALAFFVGGLLPLLYLPIRSFQHPLVNFGAPHTFNRFLWTYSGAAFTKTVQAESSSGLLWTFSQTMHACLQGTGLVLFLGLLASLLYWRRIAAPWIALSLVCSMGLTVVGRMLLGFDASTPDHHAYLMPAVSIAALVGITFLVAITKHGKHKVTFLVIASLFVSLCFRLQRNYPNVDKRKAWSSMRIAEWEFSKVLPRSVILLSYFQSTFRWWSLSSVYGHRPDVSILDRSFMTYPGTPEETVIRQPNLKILVDAPVKAGVETPLNTLNEMKTPLYIQYHPNLDAAAVHSSLPAGPFGALFAPEAYAPMLEKLDSIAAKELADIESQSLPSEERNVFDARLWHNMTRLNALCIRGKTRWAQSIFSSLPKEVAASPELKTLAIGCGLKSL